MSARLESVGRCEVVGPEAPELAITVLMYEVR